MIGWILLCIIIAIEFGMMVVSIKRRENIKLQRAFVRIGELLLVSFLIVIGVIEWSFRIKGLLVSLFLLAIYSAVVIIKQRRGQMKVKEYRCSRSIRHTITMGGFLTFVTIPAIIFPQYQLLKTTGEYLSHTISYTWSDETRDETFTETKDARNVTVEFYYPSEYKDGNKLNTKETFPLIVFSHGAFGYIDSNYSLYQELASNGYVVCSISHTYHAFFTNETNGTMKLVNMQFMQQAIDATNGLYDREDEFALTQEWMDLRVDDMNFVLDQIEDKVNCAKEEEPFLRIDFTRIGLVGHSLGGATCVEVGREHEGVKAVIVLDGTHLGERLEIVDGEYVYNEQAYPVPVLDLRAEDHSESVRGQLNQYVNDHTIALAAESKAITIEGTGHMNFTDLPMFSPFLAGMLGCGDCNAKECIELIDSLCLQWFNHYIKGASLEGLQEVYTIQ